MKKQGCIFVLILFGYSLAFGQIKVGNEHEVIHPSSLLELESQSQVFVLTKVSQEEMEKIVPLSGALVFNTTKNCLFYYHSTWIPLCELSPDMIESLWSGISNHQHELTTHGHSDIPSHTHEEISEHNHEALTLQIEELQNLVTVGNTHEHEIPVHTHETPAQELEIPAHTHELPAHQHEAVAHEHSPTSGESSATATLSTPDSLNLLQLRAASPGALWYANDAGNLSEIKNATATSLDVFWDDQNARLGVGTTNPTNKMHVAGEIRSQGFSNSNGSENEPSYSFKSDSNTGMFRAAADQLAFSTKGNEVLRMTKLGSVALGKTTANALLDVYGPIATKIDFIDQATATIEDYHSTVILGSSCLQLILPEPNTENKGRTYVIKNGSGTSIPINIPFAGTFELNATNTSLPVGITQLQSDGVHWQQIN